MALIYKDRFTTTCLNEKPHLSGFYVSLRKPLLKRDNVSLKPVSICENS
jgi:hypothetical protein